MQYFAKDLQSVYKILETMPKPLAVLDFMCGPVGCEFSASQSAGGLFYDKWNQDARVVALCWDGASILYSNVSDDQIEFTDKVLSRLGDNEWKGWKKKFWLAEQGHKAKIDAIAGIVAHGGPYDVSNKAIRRDYGLGNAKRWRIIKERLTRTGYVFSTGNPPLVQEPYIAIFDRNEPSDPKRNSRTWQVELFRHWASRLGFKLVVVSDFHPRQWQDAIHIPFADRNLDRLCNVISHAVLYTAPASGSGHAGMIFGSNFVLLCAAWWRTWPMITRDIMPGVLEGRGFRHFGVLDSPDGEVANNVKEYLEKKSRNMGLGR